MHAPHRTAGPLAPVLALLLGILAAAPAAAGLDIDFGAAVPVGDDGEVWLAVSSRYWDRDAQDVRRWHGRCGDPDDLAVALFLADRGRVDPGRVFALRERGLGWWEIGVRLGVPADAWFVPVERQPGPPYGKAYGHWRKHGRGGRDGFALADADARNLVAVRLLHEYYGVSVEVAMDWRASGRDLRGLTAEQYRGRHAKAQGKEKNRPAAAAGAAGGSSGLGKGHDKGKKHGKGRAG